MAQHWVHRQKKYWSLEQSYRDEQGRPRKRTIKYVGKGFDPQRAEERALAVAERAAERSDAWQKEHFGETATERKEREAAKNNLPSGLHPGPTPPVEVEKAPSPSLPSEAPAASESQPDALSESDAPGEAKE